MIQGPDGQLLQPPAKQRRLRVLVMLMVLAGSILHQLRWVRGGGGGMVVGRGWDGLLSQVGWQLRGSWACIRGP